jgi:hypothetical protein
MDLKFHPCLVECDQKGMRPVVASVVKNYDLSQIPQEVMGELDLLDEVSLYLKHEGFTEEDMKKYDYPSENL